MNALHETIRRRIERNERNAAEAKAKMAVHKADIASMLDLIGQLAEAYGEGEKVTWGHEGTLGHLRSLLIEATRHIAGFQEGVVEEALEEMRAGQ